MRIDRTNYESFFIDYIDGNLPDGLVNDLLDFVKANPDLADELKAAADIRLEAEPVCFPDKSRLLKNDQTADFAAVAYLEGDLDQADRLAFENELTKNQQLLTTVALLQQTRLKPDLSVTMPGRESLTRKPSKVALMWTTRAAAMVLLALAVKALVPSFTETRTPVGPNRPMTAQAERQPAETVETAENRPAAAENHLLAEAANSRRPAAPETKPSTQTPENQTEEDHNKPTTREELPAALTPRTALIDRKGFDPEKVKMVMDDAQQHTRTLTVEEYLAYKLIDAPKGESFTLANLASAGLRVASNISNDRLAVERNQTGQIEQINFESRLIAFSIPFKKNR